jgi:hypothetical protein
MPTLTVGFNLAALSHVCDPNLLVYSVLDNCCIFVSGSLWHYRLIKVLVVLRNLGLLLGDGLLHSTGQYWKTVVTYNMFININLSADHNQYDELQTTVLSMSKEQHIQPLIRYHV